MDVNQVLPAYHRLRMKQLVNSRIITRSPAVRDYVIADIFVGNDEQIDSARQRGPVAPQGIGETTHAAVEEDAAAGPAENALDVRDTEQTSPANVAEYAHRYRVYSYLNTSDIRRRMEDNVRRRKRARLPCPHCTDDRQCSRLYIRCGERSQFSVRETAREQHYLHHCNYVPGAGGDHVLIVDDDERMQGFCRSAFSLFLDYDSEKIVTAGSAGEAFEELRRSKMEGRRLGLLISDIAMPHRTGFDLVNELYYRNYDIEILLMKDEREEIAAPQGYTGGIEVLPGRPFVSSVLTKPFHSDKLVDAVRRLRFGRLLE
jgi:CheY-like chemotaxis protein